MSIIELRCTSCFAPIDPTRGPLQRCAYCGMTLVVGAPGTTAARAPQSATLRLEACGPNKISVIKVIRDHTGLGLKEAKELSEGAPCVLAEWDDPIRLEHFRADLADVGARTSGVAPTEMAPFRSAPSGVSRGPGVFLEDCGRNKIGVIKVVRDLMRLGLKEAKDLVESAPCVVGESCDSTQMSRLRSELIAAGARVR